MNNNAQAWAYASRLFAQAGTFLESTLSDAERQHLSALGKLKAVTQVAADSSYALCPYCQLLRGQVSRGEDGLICNCIDCGSVRLADSDLRTWSFNADWLTKQIRLALDIPAQQAAIPIRNDLWRLGYRDHHAVILARNIDVVLQQHKDWDRACAGGRDTPWLITPKPLREIDLSDLGHKIDWLPMEERFTIFGGALRFIEQGQFIARDEDDINPVHGPFSKDFRWVRLDDWPHGPIALSDAQTAVFSVLWRLKGEPHSAYAVMTKAGYTSDKLNDVFKVKPKNKGDLKYEGQHFAYKKLVTVTRTDGGTYAMRCAKT